MELTKHTINQYVEILQSYKSEALIYAFERTQLEWDEASKFPPPAFILERIAEMPEYRITKADRVLDIPKPDWKLEPGEIEEMLQESRKNQNTIRNEVNRLAAKKTITPQDAPINQNAKLPQSQDKSGA